MFGDDSTQTDATATDSTVNPALPPAGMGDPLATPAAPADDTSSFPSAPVVDNSATSPAADDSTTDTATPSDATPVPEADATLGQDLSAAAPAAVIDDASDATQADDSTLADVTTESTETETTETEPESPETLPEVDMGTTSDATDTPTVSASTGELVDIKQQALEQLSPLVDKLDQTPEERFRTTMMMIQASDNQSLVKQAFDAAQAITDDKARAQALLDVINEINYFTTQPKA